MNKTITLSRDENGGVHIEYCNVKKNDVLIMISALVVHSASALKMAVKDIIRIVFMTSKRITEGNDEAAGDK